MKNIETWERGREKRETRESRTRGGDKWIEKN